MSIAEKETLDNIIKECNDNTKCKDEAKSGRNICAISGVSVRREPSHAGDFDDNEFECSDSNSNISIGNALKVKEKEID